MDHNQALLLKELFTNVSKNEKEILKTFNASIVNNFKILEPCQRFSLFEKVRRLGQGMTASGVLVCLNETCNPSIVLKIALINTNNLSKILPLDESRPEYTEVKIHKKINTILSRFNEDNKFPHYLEFLNSFVCNTFLHKKFKNFVLRFGSTIIFNHENNEEGNINDHYYMISIMEYADSGSIQDLLKDDDDDFDEELMIKLIFQVIMVRAYLEKYYPTFRHNDYHPNNILLKTRNKNIYYELNGEEYFVQDPVFSITITDFDYSCDDEIENKKLIQDFRMNDIQNTSTSYTDMFRFFVILYRRIIFYNQVSKFENVMKFIRSIIPEKIMFEKYVMYDRINNKLIDVDEGMVDMNNDEKILIVSAYNVYEDRLKHINFDTSDKTALKLIDHPFFEDFKIN